MNLKKIIPVLLMTMCVSLVMPAFAANENPAPVTERTSGEAHAQQLMNRLVEIRDMDKSNLTLSERKALRKDGVYLSVGAIIIIALLLIILL